MKSAFNNYSNARIISILIVFFLKYHFFNKKSIQICLNIFYVDHTKFQESLFCFMRAGTDFLPNCADRKFQKLKKNILSNNILILNQNIITITTFYIISKLLRKNWNLLKQSMRELFDKHLSTSQSSSP